VFFGPEQGGGGGGAREKREREGFHGQRQRQRRVGEEKGRFKIRASLIRSFGNLKGGPRIKSAFPLKNSRPRINSAFRDKKSGPRNYSAFWVFLKFQPRPGYF